jgi:hypothetical protein
LVLLSQESLTSELLLDFVFLLGPLHVVGLDGFVTAIPIAPRIHDAQQRADETKHVRQRDDRILNA